MKLKFDTGYLRGDYQTLLGYWGSDDCYFEEWEIALIMGKEKDELKQLLKETEENHPAAYEYYKRIRRTVRNQYRFEDRNRKQDTGWMNNHYSWDYNSIDTKTPTKISPLSRQKDKISMDELNETKGEF